MSQTIFRAEALRRYWGAREPAARAPRERPSLLPLWIVVALSMIVVSFVIAFTSIPIAVSVPASIACAENHSLVATLEHTRELHAGQAVVIEAANRSVGMRGRIREIDSESRQAAIVLDDAAPVSLCERSDLVITAVVGWR